MIIPRIEGIDYVGVAPQFDLADSSTGLHSGKNKRSSKPKITVLNNGLTIVTERKPDVLSGGVNVFVNVGSVFEDDSNSGATHFLEHMAFKRTKNRTGKQIVEDAESSGASINAATSDESTHYHTCLLGENITVPTLVFLDMLLNNRMHEREFETEKGVILEEAKGREDTPRTRVYYLAQETYHRGHPYGKRIIGSQESISRMQPSDLKRFLHDYYTPNNMFVSLCGNFDVDRAIKEIEDATSRVNRQAVRKDIPPLTYNVEHGMQDMDVQQSHVLLMTKGYSLLNNERYALWVLDQAFGSGLSSRLFRNVRDKSGWCYAAYSHLSLSSYGGTFMVYGGFKKDKVQDGINLILKEMKKIKKAGLKPDELERAKTQIRTTLVLSSESTAAGSYGNGIDLIFRKRIIPIEEDDRRVREVTNDDIMRVANEIFDPNFIAAYVVGPKSDLPRNIEISL